MQNFLFRFPSVAQKRLVLELPIILEKMYRLLWITSVKLIYFCWQEVWYFNVSGIECMNTEMVNLTCLKFLSVGLGQMRWRPLLSPFSFLLPPVDTNTTFSVRIFFITLPDCRFLITREVYRIRIRVTCEKHGAPFTLLSVARVHALQAKTSFFKSSSRSHVNGRHYAWAQIFPYPLKKFLVSVNIRTCVDMA